jgi:hypothetical protein
VAGRPRPERRQEVFAPLPGRRQDWKHQVRTWFHGLPPPGKRAFETAHLVTILLLEDRLELGPHLLSVLIREDMASALSCF